MTTRVAATLQAGAAYDRPRRCGKHEGVDPKAAVLATGLACA